MPNRTIPRSTPDIVDYHPAMSNLNHILEQLQGIVSFLSEFAKVLKEKSLLSFCRPKNLKDHLVRSKLCRGRDRKNGMVKCNKKRRQVGNFIRQEINIGVALLLRLLC